MDINRLTLKSREAALFDTEHNMVRLDMSEYQVVPAGARTGG